MRPSRLALPLVLLALLSSSGWASAGPTPPLVTDAKGDPLLPDARFDIVSATLRTTGTTRRAHGRSVYTPTHLVATVTMAGPPDPHWLNVQLVAHEDTCGPDGKWTWSYYGDGGSGTVRPYGDMHSYTCPRGRGDYVAFLEAEPFVRGNDIIWTVSLRRLGDLVPVGAAFDDFRVYANVQGPLVGTQITQEEELLIDHGLNHRGPNNAIDVATSTQRYDVR